MGQEWSWGGWEMGQEWRWGGWEMGNGKWDKNEDEENGTKMKMRRMGQEWRWRGWDKNEDEENLKQGGLRTFNSFFVPVNELHNYNTRLSSSQSYALLKSRTNYGIYNIRFQGPKIWNSIDIKIKTSSLAVLKKNLKSCYIDSY